MDVNGTKFHLLYGSQDWQGKNKELPDKLQWDNSIGCLTLKPLPFRFPISTMYLFCWDLIPGTDNDKLLDFINRKFNTNWIKPIKIEKIDNKNTIKVYDEKNVIFFRLNNEQNGINIEINNEISYKLKAKKEEDKLNIFSIVEGMVTPSDRRGADIDRYGNIYWIDNNRHEIRILNSGSLMPSHFWSSDDLNDECKRGDFQNEKKVSHETLYFSGLAVTEYHYLVVGVVSPPGFLVFDLLSGGSPVQMLWEKNEDFSPFDIEKVPGCGVLILDRKNKKCHLLDRYLRLASYGNQIDNPPDETDFKQENLMPERNKNAKVTTYRSIETSFSIEAQHPVSVAAISKDSFVVLDSDHEAGYSVLYFYKKGKRIDRFLLDKTQIDSIDEKPDMEQSYAILGHDIAFIPDANQKNRGKLYLADTYGNQVYAFEVFEMEERFVLNLLPEYYPMRLFSGKALVSDGKLAYYDLKERWLPIIKQEVPLFARKSDPLIYDFDGKAINCVWHRLLLDAYIPQGASVRIESKAANEKEALSYLEWQEEPHLYLRKNNTEIPYYSAFPEKQQRMEGQGTWEFLFQRAVGRFLALRLTIEGTGTNSPALQALRVHYPRFSYLKKYLPSVYQDDPVSASFLDRYLSNIEGTFTEIEGKIQNVQALFDVDTVPSEYLGWLASWVGIILDPEWEDWRKRLFLSRAVSLYRESGTIRGLLRTIRLFTDPCPDETIFETDTTASGRIRESVRIVEKYRLRKAPGVVFGDPFEAQGPGVTADISKWSPVDGALHIHEKFIAYMENRYQTKGTDLFSWNKIPGNDSLRLIEFIKQKFGISWIETAEIEKINDGKNIRIYAGNNYILLELNDLKTKANLRIHDGRTCEFITKNENDNLNVYPSFENIKFPPVLPRELPAANDWKFFLKNWLGFMYAEVSTNHQDTFRNFLKKRYRKIQELNDKYHLKLNSFEEVLLPSVLPEDETVLSDWIQFVSTVLPIRMNAHRFIVLVPQKPDDSDDDIDKRIEKVRRIVAIEKPAHTVFDIKPYFSLLRVGEARLGIDTELGRSCRFTTLSIGKTRLAEGALASYRPADMQARVYVWD